MPIKVELLANIPPTFNIRPLPLMTTDYITLGFHTRRDGKDYLFNALVTYEIKEGLEVLQYKVTEFQSVYRVKAEGVPTVEELYTIAEQAVHALNELLRFYLLAQGMPQKNILCPPLSHVQKTLELQILKFQTL